VTIWFSSAISKFWSIETEPLYLTFFVIFASKYIWVTTWTFRGHVTTGYPRLYYGHFRDNGPEKYRGHGLDLRRSHDVINHVTTRFTICQFPILVLLEPKLYLQPFFETFASEYIWGITFTFQAHVT